MVRFGARPRRRVLFVGEAVSLAHVTRPLVLSGALDRDRFDACFATDRRMAALVESGGLEVHELASIAPEEFFGRIARGRPAYDEETLRGYVRDELRLLARLSPDLVVGDFRLSLAVSCRLAGVPFANLCNAHWSPFSAFDFPVPDVPQTRIVGRFLSRLALPFLLARHAEVHSRLRRSFGLPPVKSLFEAYASGDWTLYADLPEIAPTHDLPENHRYLGPILWEGAGELPEDAHPVPGRLCAYVTAGSSGGSRLQQLAEIGARAAGCEVLASRPGALLPGIRAAAASDVVVCHGGSGTAYQALSRGVPVVGLVANPDQMLVMRGVERSGAGLGLLARKATTAAVAGAVRRVLSERSFHDSARILSGSIAACDARAAFARFAEEALGPDRPASAAEDLPVCVRTSRASLTPAPQSRSRLTECLRRLEVEADLSADGDYRFGPGGEFSVRVASSIEDRLAAWQLAYRVYREKEYARPNPDGLWYSIHDALPETVTVLVERTAVEGGGWKVEGRGNQVASTLHHPPSTVVTLIGAVTVVPDSSLGLPVDATFPQETARMRAEGRRLAEAVSLVQGNLSERSGMLVAARLCELTCIVAQRLLGATDLVITVNPRHENYYRRVMLFEKRGGEAACDKVSGAPAVFLTLNFAEMQRHIERTELPEAPKTIYRRFMKPAEAGAVAHHLARQRRPLDEAALRKYFALDRPSLATVDT